MIPSKNWMHSWRCDFFGSGGIECSANDADYLCLQRLYHRNEIGYLELTSQVAALQEVPAELAPLYAAIGKESKNRQDPISVAVPKESQRPHTSSPDQIPQNFAASRFPNRKISAVL